MLRSGRGLLKPETEADTHVTKTGLIYEPRLEDYYCQWDENYSENPRRIIEPFKRCQEYGLIDRCTLVKSRFASEEDVELQHGREYIDLVKSTVRMNEEELKEMTSQYDSVFFHQKSYESGLLSLGSVLSLLDEVLIGTIRNGMAIVRPPGHHASKDEACGYCYFNNIGVAAKYAQDNYDVGKVLIVDWDVHHGQATQRMFYNDPSVLYISVHRYENGSYWPHLRESDFDHIGQEKGLGFNINIPVNDKGLGDSDYMAFFNQIIMPIAYEFCPDLVLVSAGFDAALGDQKGEMEVSPSAFAHFTQMLMGLADGRVCLLQEGGYCLQSLSEGLALCLKTLLGDAIPSVPSIGEPKQTTIDTILNVITVQRPHWRCFQYQTVSEELFSANDISFNGIHPENRPKKYDITNRYPVLSEEDTNFLEWRLNQLVHETKLLTTKHRTCLVYDSRMRLHKNQIDANHPERPDRITRIYEQHHEDGLVKRCHRVESRFATKDELEACHPLTYVEEIEAVSKMDESDLRKLEPRYNSVYLTQEAFSCACLAAGSLLNVVDSILKGESRNGVAIIRPPGHHAEEKLACGFCFFNNVAIAAKYAQNDYRIKKILIVDWDIHHGNGTQRIFENDPSVLYMSLHRYDHGMFFPGGNYGSYEQVGCGDGEGFSVNIPWQKRGVGDGEYLAAFQQVVMPIAREYNPELVLVCAGFDAARGDPLGGCRVTPQCYAVMTSMLCGLAQGRVVLALEGGYNLCAISQSMSACTRVLLGDPCPTLQYQPPCSSAVRSICDVLDVQKMYWKSLKFRETIKCTEADVEKVSESSPSSDTPSEEIGQLIEDLKNTSVHDDENAKSPNTNNRTEDHVVNGANESNTTVNGYDAIQEASKQAVNELVKLEDEEEEKRLLAMACGGSEGACGGNERDGSTLLIDGMKPEGFVVPLPWCPHLELITPLPSEGLDVKSPCFECGTQTECWLCLTCYEVYCGRYVQEHMVLHGVTKEHYMVLSYADLSVWCYGCDSYVHNEMLYDVKRAAHIGKFGEDIPY